MFHILGLFTQFNKNLVIQLSYLTISSRFLANDKSDIQQKRFIIYFVDKINIVSLKQLSVTNFYGLIFSPKNVHILC